MFVFSFVIKPSPLQLEVQLEPASTLLVVLTVLAASLNVLMDPDSPGVAFSIYTDIHNNKEHVVSLMLCIACTDLIYK